MNFIGDMFRESLIPGKFAHFIRLFEQQVKALTPQSKQWRYCNCNTPKEHIPLFSSNTTKEKFVDLSRNQLPVNFKHLIGLKITLVEFTYQR